MAAQLIAKVVTDTDDAKQNVGTSRFDRPELLMVLPDFTIRRYRPSDAERLTELANNENVARHTLNRFPHPYTLNDAHSYIAKVSHPSTNAWAISLEPEGPVVGGCGLDPGFDVFSANAEIGYWLGEPYWGKGLATKVAKALTDWAFDQEHGIAEGKPALLRIGSGVFAGNPASGKVLKKCGYSHTGCMEGIVVKFGQVRDMEIYGLTRDQWLKLQKS